jgi:hypothetical protein
LVNHHLKGGDRSEHAMLRGYHLTTNQSCQARAIDSREEEGYAIVHLSFSTINCFGLLRVVLYLKLTYSQNLLSSCEL